MELEKAYEIFKNIEREIDKLKDSSGSLPEEFECDRDDEEESYKHDMARTIVGHLDDIKSELDWLKKPVQAEGIPSRNSNGRFELAGVELSSGYPIDAWDDTESEWFRTRIEHRDDYYIYDLKNQKIEDTLIRIR